MQGVVKDFVPGATWGFLETDHGTKIFFERRSWKGKPEELRPGIAVQFEIKASSYKGKIRPKAVKISAITFVLS